MPLSKEEQAKVDAIKHNIKKQNTKLIDEERRFGNLVKSERFQEVDVEQYALEHYTFGNKLADKVAKVGGSWGFVISFVVILVTWMTINVMQIFGLHFDPYPFILLNLFLSCISAIQAPIIMMSQNRQAEQDKLDRDNDAKTNKKAELELKLLHSKLDHHGIIQQEQSKLLELIAKK
ncbi:MAG: hypothetical protein [Caudoviricetes sp.]|nr:MAG: hypothetical protein [Caudoviricetes sp.]